MKSLTIKLALHLLLVTYPLALHALAIRDLELVARDGDATFQALDIQLAYTPAPGSKKRNAHAELWNDVQKRNVVSRPIDNCPGDAQGQVTNDFNNFEGSYCDYARSSPAYTIACSDASRTVSHSSGSCNPNEICIDGPIVIENHQTASCVSGGATEALPQALLPNELRRVTIPAPDAAPGNMVAELILTGQNNDGTRFQATTISITAIDATGAETQEGIECADCNHIIFGPAAAGTTALSANITLPHVNDIAELTTFSWTSRPN